MTRTSHGRATRGLLVLLALSAPSGVDAQPIAARDTVRRPPVGRDAAVSLEIPELEFDVPEARLESVEGVPVLFLEDRTLPLVDVYLRAQGGYANFDRAYYAPATALSSLLRSGGTRRLPPDSVDELLDFYALQTTFGGGGDGTFSHLNTLSENLDEGLRLWGEMLREPRFDSARIEVWRGQALEGVRRRADNPARLAFSEFNRLMFGDHPTGWEMAPPDLEPDKLTRERMRWIHRRVLCTGNLYVGVTGDLSWERARTLLEEMLADFPTCPEDLPEPPAPELRREGAVFLIPRELNQSTVVMAEPGGVRRRADSDYYASRIANSILGASGLNSRLMARVRTERGLAYSASSLWTAPASHEGIVGAITRTRGESTVTATRLVLEILGEMRREPPEEHEVRRTIDEIVNGFVFNFQNPGQVISRQMFYLAQDLPEDWLERYLDGIQRVTPADVRRVVAAHVDPAGMTVLILGDPELFEAPLDSLGLGEPRRLEIENEVEPADSTPSRPRGSPRFPG